MTSRWRSADGQSNALALEASHPELFDVISELDAFGHRTLSRLGHIGPANGMDAIVSMLMTRRLVTHFVGLRHLLEASAVESAKLAARALFESHLALRFLMFGGRANVDAQTKSSPTRRESRARYFYVAGERKAVYSRQAILDGRFGGSPPTRSERRRLKAEIAFEISRLAKQFPVQSRLLGAYRFQHLVKSKRRYHDTKPWYAYSFPKHRDSSLMSLAARLGLAPQYHFLYSAFSGLIHPGRVSHDGAMVSDHLGHRLEVYSPYLAEAFPFIAYWACMWQLLGLQWVGRVYLPGAEADSKAVFRKVWPILRKTNPGMPAGLY
jgi:hypothetical protein